MLLGKRASGNSLLSPLCSHTFPLSNTPSLAPPSPAGDRWTLPTCHQSEPSVPFLNAAMCPHELATQRYAMRLLLGWEVGRHCLSFGVQAWQDVGLELSAVFFPVCEARKETHQRKAERLLWTDVCVSKFRCCNPNPNVMVLVGRAFGR